MTETAVADFVGRFALDPGGGGEDDPRDCRVVMSERRLVLASDDDDRLTIPLSTVVDVAVGNVPSTLGDLFDDTVTVAYEPDDSGVRTVVIEAGPDTISQFVDVLFTCLLSGTETAVKHPTRVGGRIPDTDVASGELSIGDRRLDVRTSDGEFGIDLTDVVGFDRVQRSLGETGDSTLVVDHVDESVVVTTLLAPAAPRAVNLLGRYLRLQYDDVREEIAELTLEGPETPVLVALYSTGGDIELEKVLEGDAERSQDVVDSLREKGLVEEEQTGLSLTPTGRAVVIRRVEDVDG